VTLAQLGGGSASTAGSWEEGKLPRQDRWEGISERLGLSWHLISAGLPSSEKDYAFLRHYRNQIDWRGAPPGVRERIFAETGGDASNLVEEAAAPYGTPDMIRREIRQQIERTITLAGDDIGKLGWLREQVIQHASAPEHWDIHERVIKQVLAEERRREEEEARAAQSAARTQGKAS
jgi:hypothetical protein